MEETLDEILLKADAEGKFKKLLKQLEKDIQRAGLDREFDLGQRPATVARNLIAQLFSLIVSDFERYLNLLYLIDISEKAIKALPAQHVDELAKAVSILIVRRELLKISRQSQ